jgi:hypothetical protein
LTVLGLIKKIVVILQSSLKKQFFGYLIYPIKMIKNISKLPIRLGTGFIACILFFWGIIGSYGSFIPSSFAATTDVLEVAYDEEQEKFALHSERGHFFLMIEERDAEEENKVENYGTRSSLADFHAHTNQNLFSLSQKHLLFLLHLKKYILFHALKLDC